MTRLGYDRYFAQGGDWGALVTSAIGVQNIGHCGGIHINLVVVGTPPDEVMKNPTPEEQASLARFAEYQHRAVVMPRFNAPSRRHWAMVWRILP